jgi:predicted transcriptional regulator
MIRNSDAVDEELTKQIAENPGITMSELRKYSNINASTLRYRLMSLEFAGIIVASRSRNSTAYYVKARNNPANLGPEN